MNYSTSTTALIMVIDYYYLKFKNKNSLQKIRTMI